MTCPNCGAVYDDGCRFCGACGTPLITERKGTHRVPILIMLALSVLGVCVFFATGGTLSPAPAEFPAVSFDESGAFTVEDGALEANYTYFLDAPAITVPETVGGQTVTAIGFSGFAGFADVTVVHLPDTVEEIRSNAFAGCDSLRAMDLPPALVSIGADAFYGCESLEAVRIPASVTNIGQDAFLNCGGLAFIFYDGTIDAWKDLYPQDLPSETAVCCTDGTFYQSD